MAARTTPLLALLLLLPARLPAADLQASENFVVLAPDKELALDVLARAETWRSKIALRWLGEELPPSIGRATIRVELSDNRDEASTWVVNDPDLGRHRVHLIGTREVLTGGALAHELVHVILGTQYPRRLPPWIEEGIASSYDELRRKQIRRAVLAHFAERGSWPPVAQLLDLRRINRRDQTAYTASASLTEFLLTRGDEARLLKFARAGQRDGWNAALDRHYGLRNVQELQAAWQKFARAQTLKASPLRTARLSRTQRR